MNNQTLQCMPAPENLRQENLKFRLAEELGSWPSDLALAQHVQNPKSDP